jgi:hypothetical protein
MARKEFTWPARMSENIPDIRADIHLANVQKKASGNIEVGAIKV